MKKMLWIVNPHAGRGAMRGKLIDCILAFQEAASALIALYRQKNNLNFFEKQGTFCAVLRLTGQEHNTGG